MLIQNLTNCHCEKNEHSKFLWQSKNKSAKIINRLLCLTIAMTRNDGFGVDCHESAFFTKAQILAMTKRGINLAMTGIFDDFTHPLNPPPQGRGKVWHYYAQGRGKVWHYHAQGRGNLWIAAKKLHFFAMTDFSDSR